MSDLARQSKGKVRPCSPCSRRHHLFRAVIAVPVPTAMPTAQPTNKAQSLNPAGISTEDYRRQSLNDPDAARELQVNRVLRRYKNNENESAEFDD